MSWWDTGNNDDVIGDEPADLVRHGLQQIVETRSQQSKEKPKLADLLRAIGAVTIAESGKVLDGAPGNLREIVAELKTNRTVSSGVLSAKPEAGDLVSILTANLVEIAAVYKERWERNPRLSEWLETLSFVLRARAEEFLEDGSEHPPSQLVVTTGKS
jgi:hypothetical protein